MAEIDRAAFGHAVLDMLDQHGLSYRDAVARWPHLNTAMLSRACSGQVISAANMLAVCKALGLDPMAFLIEGKRPRRTMKSIVKQAVTAAASRETERGAKRQTERRAKRQAEGS